MTHFIVVSQEVEVIGRLMHLPGYEIYEYNTDTKEASYSWIGGFLTKEEAISHGEDIEGWTYYDHENLISL